MRGYLAFSRTESADAAALRVLDSTAIRPGCQIMQFWKSGAADGPSARTLIPAPTLEPRRVSVLRQHVAACFTRGCRRRTSTRCRRMKAKLYAFQPARPYAAPVPESNRSLEARCQAVAYYREPQPTRPSRWSRRSATSRRSLFPRTQGPDAVEQRVQRSAPLGGRAAARSGHESDLARAVKPTIHAARRGRAASARRPQEDGTQPSTAPDRHRLRTRRTAEKAARARRGSDLLGRKEEARFHAGRAEQCCRADRPDGSRPRISSKPRGFGRTRRAAFPLLRSIGASRAVGARRRRSPASTSRASRRPRPDAGPGRRASGDWSSGPGRRRPRAWSTRRRSGAPFRRRFHPGPADGRLLLATPYLSWSWNMESHGEGLHPVR